MTTIVYQAGDALLHVVRPYLLGDMWSDRVYSKHAPAKISESFDLWVVCRVTGDAPNTMRGDRSGHTLSLAVQAVGKESARNELAAARIYDLLHESGINDRRSVSVGVHDEWHFLNVTVDRAIRLVPNPNSGTRFYENGYVFTVMMEAKNGYV